MSFCFKLSYSSNAMHLYLPPSKIFKIPLYNKKYHKCGKYIFALVQMIFFFFFFFRRSKSKAQFSIKISVSSAYLDKYHNEKPNEFFILSFSKYCKNLSFCLTGVSSRRSSTLLHSQQKDQHFFFFRELSQIFLSTLNQYLSINYLRT